MPGFGSRCLICALAMMLACTPAAKARSWPPRDGRTSLRHHQGQDGSNPFPAAEGNIDLLPKLAAELVALRLDVIVALYTPCALAAATRPMPMMVS